MKQDFYESPGEIKSREADFYESLDVYEESQERSRAGRWRWTLTAGSVSSCLAAELFFNGCFSDTVVVNLLRTAVETAVSEVHKLLGTGGVPTSLTSLFWRWLTVSSVFAGRSSGTNYSSVPDPPSLPLFLSLISRTVSVDVKHHEKRWPPRNKRVAQRQPERKRVAMFESTSAP